MKRRSRSTSDEERALFFEVLRHATPLGGRFRTPHKPPPRAAVEPGHVAPQAAPASPKPPPLPRGEAPALGGHREAHARRGRLEPEARIDLHGLTQDEAFRALMRFFGRARAHDQRVVLVITGKTGVLNRAVPRWLSDSALAPLVAGATPAHIRHGGSGALYVALRRKSRP